MPVTHRTGSVVGGACELLALVSSASVSRLDGEVVLGPGIEIREWHG